MISFFLFAISIPSTVYRILHSVYAIQSRWLDTPKVTLNRPKRYSVTCLGIFISSKYRNSRNYTEYSVNRQDRKVRMRDDWQGSRVYLFRFLSDNFTEYPFFLLPRSVWHVLMRTLYSIGMAPVEARDTTLYHGNRLYYRPQFYSARSPELS